MPDGMPYISVRFYTSTDHFFQFLLTYSSSLLYFILYYILPAANAFFTYRRISCFTQWKISVFPSLFNDLP